MHHLNKLLHVYCNTLASVILAVLWCRTAISWTPKFASILINNYAGVEEYKQFSLDF